MGRFGRRRATSEPKTPAALPVALPAVPAVVGRPALARAVPPPVDRRSTRAARLSSTAVEAPLEPQAAELDPLRIALAAVLRITSLAWLAAGVEVWARLIGYLDTPLTLSWHAADGPWLTSMTAAVVIPVVAVGLWLVSSWGAVLWAGAVAVDAALAITAPALMPFGIAALLGNAAALVTAGALATAKAIRDRSRGED